MSDGRVMRSDGEAYVALWLLEFEELVARPPRDAEAICEWTLELLDASDAMHADLQRRFLRAFTYGIADMQDAS